MVTVSTMKEKKANWNKKRGAEDWSGLGLGNQQCESLWFLDKIESLLFLEYVSIYAGLLHNQEGFNAIRSQSFGPRKASFKKTNICQLFCIIHVHQKSN